MTNIRRMEDIIDIVGMDNYIKSLKLDNDSLTFVQSKINERKKGWADLGFTYEDHTIVITIDSTKNIKDIKCDCNNFSYPDYCDHASLAVMYILTNEDIVDNALDQINVNYDYDADFNQTVFNLFNNNLKNHLIGLDIMLKQINTKDEYELIVKIGDIHKYVLKKNLQIFMDTYQDQNIQIEFGKSFIYDSSKHYFNSIDQQILDFLKLYVDSQNSSYRTYYGFYQQTNLSMIKLSGSSLKSFLNILKNKPFTIQMGYREYSFDNITDNYDFDIKIDQVDDKVKLLIDYYNITPITSDYQYVMMRNKCYYFDNNFSKLIKIMNEKNRKKMTFKEEELNTFSQTIYPSILSLNNKVISDKVKKKFIDDTLSVKYYFSHEDEKVIGLIKLDINGKEISINDNTNSFNGTYIIRNKKEEKKYILELTNLNFSLKDNYFYLEKDNDIINFLENGLKDLTKKYDVFVSKELKNMKVISKVGSTSMFSIGKDNILKYQFNVDGIGRDEISSLLECIHTKKKYYKLKNGNYVDLNNSSSLNELSSIVSTLNLSEKDLLNDTIELSKYQSMKIDAMRSDNVKIDDELEKLISKFNKYKNLDITISEDDKKVLRDYQITGIKWMLTIANCRFGGILADEMGLGKSIQTIYYIKKRIEEDNSRKIVIIVPTSLIYNWENELFKFGSDIKYKIINGTKEQRIKLLNFLNDTNVIITSYGLIRQDIDLYQEIHFDTCIIDEAQNIKNINTDVTKCVKMLHSDVNFALTGTPIENSIIELWSIFDFIMPGFLMNVHQFKLEYRNMDDEQSVDKLKTSIRPFILRRMKKEVLLELPDKNENNVIVELTDEQKKVYLAQLEKTKKQLDSIEDYNKNQILILSLLTRLRQICIDPRLYIEDYTGGSAKITMLIDIVKEVVNNGHKVLVFSQYPSALQYVGFELSRNKLSYYYLDGSTKSKTRIELVDNFNSDDTNVFLISLKAGGTGLNLTSADVVIHLDPWWNPQVENQATDRSHRIGQKHVVDVIKIITKGTIEEKIIELQNKKKNLSDNIIDGESREEIVLSKLTKKELRDLLS